MGATLYLPRGSPEATASACAGFACALGPPDRVRPAAPPSTTRPLTTAASGALAGALGQVIARRKDAAPLLSGPLDSGQRTAIVAGLLISDEAVSSGCCRACIASTGVSAAHAYVVAQPVKAQAMRRRGFGVFNGLPCLWSMPRGPGREHRRSPPRLSHRGIIRPDLPAMLLMGGVGTPPAWRQRGVWLAGSCILLLGLITLGRGLLPIAAHVADSWHGGHAI